MSKAGCQTDLQRRLTHLGSRIDAAHRRLERGDLAAKVQAAGELAELEARRKRVRESLDALQREPEGGWHAVSASVREELEDVIAGIERWFERY